MNSYQFIVTEHHDLTTMQQYHVIITCDDMRVTARIIERDGNYNLIDINFNKAVGLCGMHHFISDLYEQRNTLLPATVSQYNERLLKASA